MKVMTFEGSSVEDVLPQIREELGDNAVVLSQRQKINGGVGGFFGKRITEVLAADRMPNDDELVELEDQYVDDEGDDGADTDGADPWTDQSPSPSGGVIDLTDDGEPAGPILSAVRHDTEASNRAAAAPTQLQNIESDTDTADYEPLEIAEAASTIDSTPIDEVVPEPEPAPEPTVDPEVAEANQRAIDLAQRAQGALAAATSEIEHQISETRSAQQRAQDAEAKLAAIADQAPAVEQMMTAPVETPVAKPQPVPVAQPAPDRPTPTQPDLDEAPQLLQELIECGVEPDIAQGILTTALTHRRAFTGKPDLRRLVREAIIDNVRVSPGWRDVGKQHRMAIVGPTGAGKSTVAAKLAEGYERNAGFKVGVVAIVSPSVAARRNAGPVNPLTDRPHLDVRYVTNSEQMIYVLERFASADLVIIDTPGSAYFDDETMKVVRNCLTIADVADVQAVLPLGTSPREAQSVLEHFGCFPSGRVVISKTDESKFAGQLLNFGFRLRLPITYLSDGPSIPEDLHAASALEIAELIVPYEESTE